MRARPFVLILLAAVLGLALGCSGGSAGPDSSDKLIRLPIALGTFGTSDTAWQARGEAQALHDFDIRDYPGVDSVVLVAYMQSAQPGARLHMRLFNHTDTLEIPGSDITPSITSGQYVHSANIRAALPNRRITIGFMLRANRKDDAAGVMNPTLYLYRR